MKPGRILFQYLFFCIGLSKSADFNPKSNLVNEADTKKHLDAESPHEYRGPKIIIIERDADFVTIIPFLGRQQKFKLASLFFQWSVLHFL